MHHGVPQSRDRIYVAFWRKGLQPDLELELTAWCSRCSGERTVRQGWKPGRTVGRYRQQWQWHCATCNTVCEPSTEPAASIIDWELACPRIGDRRTKSGKPKPLAEATRARILAGLQRYGFAPIVTSGAGNVHERTPGNRARPLTDPLPTQQTTATTALATPSEAFLFNTAHGGRTHALDEPHPTVCAADDRLSLIIPMRRNGRARPTNEPVPTATAGGFHHGLLMRNNTGGDEMITPVEEPARTMTTKGHQSLLVPYNGKGQAAPVDRPIGTVTASDRWSLLDLERIVDDCGFRMLEPHEIAAAMAFPRGYIPTTLPKKDRVKLAGNAVTPPVMAWITGRLIQALERAA